MSNIISKTLMWLVWGVLALGSVTVAHYATGGIKDLNSFGKPFDVVAAVLFAVPAMAGIALRVWLGYIRNPWLALLPFLLGVFCANQAAILGPFVVPEFCILFQVLGGFLFAVYLPLFVQLRPAQPKPPSLGGPDSRV